MLGRSWQLATLQLDFLLPERFNLMYQGENEMKRPVIIHRAVLGSFERFMAIIIEHTGGRWPFWLNPNQALIVPVSQKYLEYAQRVNANLLRNGYQSSVDKTNLTLRKKIRNAQVAQSSYILVVGAQEEEDGTVHVRNRDGQQLGSFELEDLYQKFRKEEIF